MKIKRKDLHAWISAGETIRYRGELYKAHYNGLRYFMTPILGGGSVDFYHKGRGVYGLRSNKSITPD